jgi:hypothetical protein
MINQTHHSLETDKIDLNQQKSKPRQIARVLLAALIPIVLFLGIVSLPDLVKAVDRIVFLVILGLIIGFSVALGLLEHTKTKKSGKKRSIIFLSAQVLLSLICILMLFYIQLFK